MYGTAEVKYHVRPRFRAYGKARIDIAQRARSPEEWKKLWKPSQYTFPFEWGPYWKQCIEYRVDDFAAEVGFFIDVLGFPVNAFNPEYAMFTSPRGEFYIAVVQAQSQELATPPDTFRLQFMVSDLSRTVAELERRGILFEQAPAPITENSTMYAASFRTPHGICVELWGIEPSQVSSSARFEVVDQDDQIEPLKETVQLDRIDRENISKGVPPHTIQLTPEDDTEDDTEDLFEEVQEEPASESAFRPNQRLRAPRKTQELDPEYVDIEESDADFPVYKPIPLRY